MTSISCFQSTGFCSISFSRSSMLAPPVANSSNDVLSSASRRESRCKLCGRPRAVYRKFGICRICFRNLADEGVIPGVKKASW